MRKLIYAINLTVDGCCDHTKMMVDAEMMAYHTRLVGDAGMLVYGRKTYQLMVPYWPDVAKNHSGPVEGSNEFADAFDAVDKIVVFSRTLDEPDGKNTEIIRTNLRDEILKLKQGKGKYMLTGGADIPSQLIGLGLVGEYHFVIHPVLAGEGRRLLEGISLAEKLNLKLVTSKVFASGSVALHYLKQ